MQCGGFAIDLDHPGDHAVRWRHGDRRVWPPLRGALFQAAILAANPRVKTCAANAHGGGGGAELDAAGAAFVDQACYRAQTPFEQAQKGAFRAGVVGVFFNCKTGRWAQRDLAAIGERQDGKTLLGCGDDVALVDGIAPAQKAQRPAGLLRRGHALQMLDFAGALLGSRRQRQAGSQGHKGQRQAWIDQVRQPRHF